MSHPHERSDLACRNCGTLAPLNYCAECGQETALHPPTFGEFVHEFIGHYVALEGALWRTLGLLLARPGRLTREYLAGRRRRYVLPLRLYLTASFLFFLVLKLLPSAIDEAASAPAHAQGMGIHSSAQAASAPALETMRPVDCGRAGEPACNATERFANGVAARFSRDPQGLFKQTVSRLIGMAPYAMFLLLPVFAGIVALAYRNRRMSYGEHFVFSLHLHSFWFLVLLVSSLLSDVLLWAIPVYGVWAMHTVYRGGWGRTLLRAAFVSAAYGALLVLATGALLVALLAKA
ncbi:DUF3667 domain-containing protein [Sphaerotilaceae bacterium SBD11-9]